MRSGDVPFHPCGCPTPAQPDASLVASTSAPRLLPLTAPLRQILGDCVASISGAGVDSPPDSTPNRPESIYGVSEKLPCSRMTRARFLALVPLHPVIGIQHQADFFRADPPLNGAVRGSGGNSVYISGVTGCAGCTVLIFPPRSSAFISPCMQLCVEPEPCVIMSP